MIWAPIILLIVAYFAGPSWFEAAGLIVLVGLLVSMGISAWEIQKMQDREHGV